MTQNYLVEYEVQGHKDVMRAGPYIGNEAEEQMQDIRSFEGVKNVKLVPITEEEASRYK